MMNIKCLFGFHKYKVVGVGHTYDTSWDGKAPSSTVVRMCICCTKVKSTYLYGAGFLSVVDFEKGVDK